MTVPVRVTRAKHEAGRHGGEILQEFHRRVPLHNLEIGEFHGVPVQFGSPLFVEQDDQPKPENRPPAPLTLAAGLGCSAKECHPSLTNLPYSHEKDLECVDCHEQEDEVKHQFAKIEDVAERVFESLRKEPHVVLLPEWMDTSSRDEVLQEFWPDIFASMLNGWLRDEAQWPQARTHAMFEEWFDVTVVSMVDDLDTDEPLEVFE